MLRAAPSRSVLTEGAPAASFLLGASEMISTNSLIRGSLSALLISISGSANKMMPSFQKRAIRSRQFPFASSRAINDSWPISFSSARNRSTRSDSGVLCIISISLNITDFTFHSARKASTSERKSPLEDDPPRAPLERRASSSSKA